MVILDSILLHANAISKLVELVLAAVGGVMGEKKRFMEINGALLEMLAQTFGREKCRIFTDSETPFYSRLCRCFLGRLKWIVILDSMPLHARTLLAVCSRRDPVHLPHATRWLNRHWH
jgi:hypothetical protein